MGLISEGERKSDDNVMRREEEASTERPFLEIYMYNRISRRLALLIYVQPCILYIYKRIYGGAKEENVMTTGLLLASVYVRQPSHSNSQSTKSYKTEF
jgi:hypothetical protein